MSMMSNKIHFHKSGLLDRHEVKFALNVCMRDGKSQGNQIYLPVDSEAIYENWMSFLGCGETDSFEQYEDDWRLLIMKTGIVATNNVIQKNVNVGDFVRMERCDQRIRVLDKVALCCYELQDETDLDDFGLVESLASSRVLMQ